MGSTSTHIYVPFIHTPLIQYSAYSQNTPMCCGRGRCMADEGTRSLMYGYALRGVNGGLSVKQVCRTTRPCFLSLSLTKAGVSLRRHPFQTYLVEIATAEHFIPLGRARSLLFCSRGTACSHRRMNGSVLGLIAKNAKVGVIASLPRMVYLKMVGLDTALVWTYLDPAHST